MEKDDRYVLSRYNYDLKMYLPLQGTADWVSVVEMGSGGYEWNEFKAFYSPSQRMYFWKGDSGCSCNSWDDDVYSQSDLENGDKDSLLRAWERYAKDNSYEYSIQDYQDGVSKIKAFSPPSVPNKTGTQGLLKDPDWDS